MDKEKALELLNLDASATLADAKKAYRTLAKRYHPDVMGEISSSEKDGEARMKNINLAYRFIVPLLKLNEAVIQDFSPAPKERPPESRSKKSEKTGWYIFLTKCTFFFHNLFFQKAEPVALKKQKRQMYPERETKKRKDPFQDVLEKVYAMPFDFEKRRAQTQKKRMSLKKYTFNDYRNYMELKRKMKFGGSRNPGMSIGRVTRIEPIGRVNAVKKE